MRTEPYEFPVSISRLSEDETSREGQNARAIRWLLHQPGESIVVVTPQKNVPSAVIEALVRLPGVTHLSWRGLPDRSLRGRVLFAWPDRKHLNELWHLDADALAVIEWNENETREWIEDARPDQLFADRVIQTPTRRNARVEADALPNGVDAILEHIAGMAAGYSSGLKWNEEDKLKADMMNRPDRWTQVSVDQVRAKCRSLGMRPDDVDTVSGLLQRRKEGRRFNVRGSYRTFEFS